MLTFHILGVRVRSTRAGRAVAALVLAGSAAFPAFAHEAYLMNHNHTDYNWNAPAAAYDASMLAELDYYLQQIQSTSGNVSEEQSRYVPDNWWWLWLYEHNRTPEQFQSLIAAIRSGHVTVPLNPFVTLYGALPTEAAIRAGYYPGRIERRFGITFRLAENMENHTSPWGLSSLWAGSGVKYTWKGVCGCAQSAPTRTGDEVFYWQGPDDKKLLFKWYNLIGANTDWGGYAEARDNLSSPSQIDAKIALSQSRMPGLSVTGLFGAGWDDVGWRNTAVLDAVIAYNASATANRAVCSNGIDFFQALEAKGETNHLATLRGGWGNDWDMWPASLAERTARNRRAFERLRTVEALAVWAQLYDPSFWTPVRADIERGLTSAWKYFEHGWDVTTGGPTLGQMQADKEAWTEDLETVVARALASADSAVASHFETPAENRVAVFNPLGFARTDAAQFVPAGPGPWVVTDVTSGLEAPSQAVVEVGATYLRFLARDVPSLGYRVYRYTQGTPSALPAAATVTPSTRTIESGRYRVVLGSRGEIIDLTDKASVPPVQLARAPGLNDFGSGAIIAITAENVGPVSATLRVDLSSPFRTVRLSLFADIDRVEVDDRITQNVSGVRMYRFPTNLPGAQIRFEELGAVSRPGMTRDGGDFLDGTRAGRMTLNHFADFALPKYHLVLSNADAFAMQVNDSTDSSFDLAGDEIRVVVMERPPGAGTTNQGGDTLFSNRFALRGIAAPWSGAEAMRTSLAHQNPLRVVPLPSDQRGPIVAPVDRLLSVSAPNVVVTAFKPAEDSGAGFVVRAWEMGGSPSTFGIDASLMGPLQARRTSLLETDTATAAVVGGVISASAVANEITTWRFTAASRDPIGLTISKAANGADIRLDWTGGRLPFAVRRSTSPDGAFVDLTPPGGTASTSWTDQGALTTPETYDYRVDPLP